MHDLILAFGLVLLAVWLFFLMSKLDRFLGDVQTLSNPGNRKVLRIAFENPAVAGAVSNGMDSYKMRHGEVEYLLYAGTAASVLQGIRDKTVDIAFLDENTADCTGSEYGVAIISLNQEAVLAASLDLPVEPLKRTAVKEKMVWRLEEKAMEEFKECMTVN